MTAKTGRYHADPAGATSCIPDARVAERLVLPAALPDAGGAGPIVL
jgi:hypothetical protein